MRFVVPPCRAVSLLLLASPREPRGRRWSYDRGHARLRCRPDDIDYAIDKCSCEKHRAAGPDRSRSRQPLSGATPLKFPTESAWFVGAQIVLPTLIIASLPLRRRCYGAHAQAALEWSVGIPLTSSSRSACQVS